MGIYFDAYVGSNRESERPVQPNVGEAVTYVTITNTTTDKATPTIPRTARFAASNALGESIFWMYWMAKAAWRIPNTKNDAKCSDIRTALKPITGMFTARRSKKGREA